jgi:hypothetical protein
VQEAEVVDQEYLTALQYITPFLKQNGRALRDVTIPAEGPGELLIHTTSGTMIKMAIDEDITSQLHSFKTFMTQKEQENPDFLPAYIDLRIPSRVYYR